MTETSTAVDLRQEEANPWRESLEQRLRERMRELIEQVLEEEVEEALGAPGYQRAATRNGYRLRQILVRDACIGVSSACTPTTFLLSQRPDGTVANDVNGSTNERPVLSGDGRFGIFRSRSTNLVLTGNNGGPHIYLAATGR